MVPAPKDRAVIETKWVFRNKMDEDGVVTRNKARLVAKGYSQEEGDRSILMHFIDTYFMFICVILSSN